MRGRSRDRFMFQEYYRDRGVNRSARISDRISPTKFQVTGSWQGPIESGFGWHLVFVDTATAGRVPDFEEIEPEVKTAWLTEQKSLAWEKAYKEMRDKYTVVLPKPPNEEISCRIRTSAQTVAAPHSQIPND